MSIDIKEIDIRDLSEKDLQQLMKKTQQALDTIKEQAPPPPLPLSDVDVTFISASIRDTAKKKGVDPILLVDGILRKMRLKKGLLEVNGEVMDLLVTVNDRGEKIKRKHFPVKYRDPDNSANTWTGLGHQPVWLVAKLKEGANLEDFLVS